MKKITTLLTILLVSTTISHAQAVIVIQSGSSTKLASRLDSAIAQAQNGDILYLSGGVYGTGNAITVNKRLSIIGAGYHPNFINATGATVINSSLRFNVTATGSFVTGINFRGEFRINGTSNFTLTRCLFNSSFLFDSSASNITISENILNFGISGGNIILNNVVINKNIIYNYINSLYNGSISVSNNIFNGNSLSQTMACVYTNNIFTKPFGSLGNPGSSLAYNNIFVGDVSGLSFGSVNNIINEPLTNIFVNYTGANTWNPADDFTLKPTFRGKNFGTDSTDIGIYGTRNPFKVGGIPFNPHIQSATVGAATSTNGLLNINIVVKAQNQ
jgi:hypothetical protein